MNKTVRLLGCTTWCVSIFLVSAVASGPATPAKAENPAGAQTGRVVAIGDVHGAYPEFVSILQHTGLIDSQLHWSGGTTTFVQTGDVPDRGPASRAAFDLLMRLESEAPKQTGKVIPLLGNHEVMNMIGDLRYVSVEDYQSFSTDQSEKVREQAWEDYKKFMSDPGHNRNGEVLDDAARQKWMAAHPPGFCERRDAFQPQGVYGRWLRGHDAIAQVGDVPFMHGGLDPELHFRNIDELNRRIHADLETFDSVWQSLSKKKIIWPYMRLDEALSQAKQTWNQIQSGQRINPSAVDDLKKFLDLPSGLLMAENSPLWYRGLALEPEGELSKGLDKMLARLKVHYIVAAHTVRPKFDITPRFDNHVFLIDTGMLNAYFHGRASALEIQNGRFTAYYADGPARSLVGSASAATVGDP